MGFLLLILCISDRCLHLDAEAIWFGLKGNTEGKKTHEDRWHQQNHAAALLSVWLTASQTVPRRCTSISQFIRSWI